MPTYANIKELNRTTHIVELDDINFVYQIKEKLATKLKVGGDKLVLILCGKTLLDNEIINDLNLPSYNCVHLIIK